MLAVKSTRFCSHGDREHSVSLALPVSLMVNSRVLGPCKPDLGPLLQSPAEHLRKTRQSQPHDKILPCARVWLHVLNVVLVARA